jgi:hypothetical protein
MTVTGGNDRDQSSLVHILTWFLFIVDAFSLAARLSSKLFLSAALAWDDWLVIASQIVLFFQSIVLSYGAGNGLGKPSDELSASQLDRALKV